MDYQKHGGIKMTNDDKDLKLKECPFCNGKAVEVVTDGSVVACGNVECFMSDYYIRRNYWNTRHPQQPSEPLKELDGKWVGNDFDDVLKVVTAKPSEKKALSVEDMKKIAHEAIRQENVAVYSWKVRDIICHAIHSAMPAQREVS